MSWLWAPPRRKWLGAIGAATLAAASANACSATSNDAPSSPLARSSDASIDDAAAPDAADSPGACGPFDAPDAAAALCSPAEQAARWASMITQPIVPPFRAAGVDLRGQRGIGLTIPEAELALCARSVSVDGGAASASWGANNEVTIDVGGRDSLGQTWRLFTLTGGYTGAVDFTSADHQHTYRIAIGDPITRDGAPLAIDWTSPAHFAVLDELLRAMAATFAPSLSLPTGPICASDTTTQHCIIASWGVETWVWYRSIGLVFWVADKSAPQPAASTPSRIDVVAPAMPCDAPAP